MLGASKGYREGSCGPGCGIVFGRQLLLVEHRPFAVRVVENPSAASEPRTLVHAPRGGVSVARFEHQPGNPFAPRQCLDLADYLSADAPALHLRPRIHPLHFADAVPMPAKRP